MVSRLVEEFKGLIGPYESWMFGVGRVFDLPGLMLETSASLTCVAEFDRPRHFLPAAEMTQGLQRVGCSGVSLPTLFTHPRYVSRFLPFVLHPHHAGHDGQVADCLRACADRIAAAVATLFGQGASSQVAGGFRANFPVRSETIAPGGLHDPEGPASVDPALGGASPAVILAVIDVGIPFAHARFRHEGTLNTRIDYCWSQSATVAGGALAPSAVLFGREYTRPQIDAWLLQDAQDEAAIYQRAGLYGRPDGPAMPLDRAQSHGAHVLDLMAGGWPTATAAQARIIAVDLPASSVWETSGFGKDMFILSALHYIFNRADRIRQAYGCADLPLVINLSYGYSGGPHDGTGLIERAMAELIGFRNDHLAPTTLVMPSGNMFHDKLHARLDDGHFIADPSLQGRRVAELQWFAPPCDRTSSFLEFWFPPGFAAENICVEVTAPGQAPISMQNLAPQQGDFLGGLVQVDDKVVAQLALDRHANGRWRLSLIVAPTETCAQEGDLLVDGMRYSAAPTGLWNIAFYLPENALPSALGQGAIECRIQRDTSYGQGKTGARQSCFVDDGDHPVSANGNWAAADTKGAKLRRFGCMNGMATGPHVVLVAGHMRSNGQAAWYSSAGGAGMDKTVGLSAPTETAAFQPGIRAAGTRSGITVALRGTSSAAPQIARLIAEMQITAPLPKGATQEDVLRQLAATYPHQPANPHGDGPDSQPRLGLGRFDPALSRDTIDINALA